jgi:Ca2+-binding RTX toxin-like protein
MSTLPRLCGLLIAALLFVPAAASAQECAPRDKRCIAGPEEQRQVPEDPDAALVEKCAAEREAGEQCGPGRGRRTRGGPGTGNVSHKGWPAITGILWKVLDSRDHDFTGTALNDELLGHHGDDVLIGLGGRDVLWGDWEINNPSNQTDILRGGDDKDFLYPSHGKNNMYGGAGNDRIIAYYGRGLIDCGPGKNDFAQTRWLSKAYRVRNCERIRHFCAFGSKPNGDCKKPGESNLARLARQAGHASLLGRLAAW